MTGGPMKARLEFQQLMKRLEKLRNGPNVSAITTAGMAQDVTTLLAKLRLKIRLLIKDPTCNWAQAQTLEAIDTLAQEASDAMAALESRLGGDRARVRHTKESAVTSRIVARRPSKSTGLIR
jgi:hypothetical protein